MSVTVARHAIAPCMSAPGLEHCTSVISVMMHMNKAVCAELTAALIVQQVTLTLVLCSQLWVPYIAMGSVMRRCITHLCPILGTADQFAFFCCFVNVQLLIALCCVCKQASAVLL